MKTKLLKSIFLIATSSLFVACNNDDNSVPPPVNEEELITTVKVDFKNQANVVVATVTFKDLDGDGPNAPVIEQIGTLMANTAYTFSTTFLNESVNPIEDISEEILEEDEDHQVFYNGSLGSFTSYGDTDANNKPVGLTGVYTTGATGTNKNFVVTLRHLPNKSANGVSAGNITNAGGETDIEATFTNLTVN
jgi:hypothetical protein